MFRQVVIISSIVVALAGTAALAQGLRGQGGLRGGGIARQLRNRTNRGAGQQGALADRVLQRLQQRLNLTDAQLNGLNALQENRRKETELLQQEVQQKRQALRQQLQQPNPNPNDVGNATLALKQTRERKRDINQRFLSGFKSLLTPDQVQKLPKRLR
jgi:Spy/CpxP family protein refolding chaperone